MMLERECKKKQMGSLTHGATMKFRNVAARYANRGSRRASGIYIAAFMEIWSIHRFMDKMNV